MLFQYIFYEKREVNLACDSMGYVLLDWTSAICADNVESSAR